jgi:hypothetical protein
MANRLCWKCDNKVHMTRQGSNTAAIEPIDGKFIIQAAFQCDECGYLSIGMAPNGAPANATAANFLDVREPTWFPTYGERTDYPDVPEHIGQAASEAHLCHSVGAYRASVLLARSVIEATAKDKGITSGPLVAKIDEMNKAEFIRKVVKDGAHEVRHLGNDMAHGDFVEPVELEESEEVLELMGEVLHDVYQQEARVARRRTAREAKRAGATD